MTALLCPWSGTVRDINEACQPLPGKERRSGSRTLKLLLAFLGNSSVGSLMSVKRLISLMMMNKRRVREGAGSFYSHWSTFCLLRGTRPTNELKVDCLG